MVIVRRGRPVTLRASVGDLPATIVHVRRRLSGRQVIVQLDAGFDIGGHVHINARPSNLRRR